MKIFIPKDVVFHILTFARRNDLAIYSLVCKLWHLLASDPYLRVIFFFIAICFVLREFQKKNSEFQKNFRISNFSYKISKIYGWSKKYFLFKVAFQSHYKRKQKPRALETHSLHIIVEANAISCVIFFIASVNTIHGSCIFLLVYTYDVLFLWVKIYAALTHVLLILSKMATG